MTSRSSRPLPRLWVIRCHTRAGICVADRARAHQFPSTGTTGQETGPRADDLFHEPEHSPENRHTRRPLPGHRSDHAHRHRDALQEIQAAKCPLTRGLVRNNARVAHERLMSPIRRSASTPGAALACPSGAMCLSVSSQHPAAGRWCPGRSLLHRQVPCSQCGKRC
jgi:hypothetical protein